MRLLKALFVFSLFFHTAAQAWWDEGHKVIAEVAHQNLSPEVREKADALAGSFKEFYPDHATFVDSSTWMDDIKGGVKAFHSWHYTNIPHDPDRILSREQKKLIAAASKDNDVVFAIEKAVETLKSPKANDFEKALMLKILIHCVGDIHQPLHCGSLYSHDHPHGDEGGCQFSLLGTIDNLHKLWDYGGGVFPSDPEKIRQAAAQLIKDYPEQGFSQMEAEQVLEWALESHELAEKFGFQMKEGEAPSQEYIENLKTVSSQQAALAGYRLAKLLNECLATE